MSSAEGLFEVGLVLSTRITHGRDWSFAEYLPMATARSGSTALHDLQSPRIRPPAIH